MPISLNPMMARQIIMDHYDHPSFKHEPKDDTYKSVHMNSANCIDDIQVFFKIENDIVVDCCFTGVACTISTASTDIMCGLIVNQTTEKANKIMEAYNHMIHEEPYDEELLDEALAFQNTSKQAARIKCATIGWDGLKEILKESGHCHEK